MQLDIVLFYFQDMQEESVGFKILPNKEAKKYKKAVKLLQGNASTFSFGSDDYEWSCENVQIKKITAGEIKVINGLFGMDYDNGFSKSIGFIPDAIEQAYEEGLTDEDGNPLVDDGQFQDQEYDDQDY